MGDHVDEDAVGCEELFRWVVDTAGGAAAALARRAAGALEAAGSDTTVYLENGTRVV